MSDEKKQILFKLLIEKSVPLSLAEILRHLPEKPPERSVRRWLQDLIQSGKIKKIGKSKSTVYQSILSDTQKNTIFSPTSQQSLEYIRQPLFKRPPKSYNAAWLEAYQPNHTCYLSAQQRQHLMYSGQRDSLHAPAGTYARKIYHRLLIDLSYNSSRLEGNTYSKLDTEKLILEGINAIDKLDEEKVMILNHKEAIRYLVENSHKISIDENAIYTLHYLLSDGLISPAYSGKVRDHGVRVSASTYMALEQASQLQKYIKVIVKKATEIRDAYEQSFFLLTHIAYLQAFSDVNKRTSRLSANIPLIKNNLVPLSFNAIDKDDYASSILAVYELNDISPLADLYIYSYARTCQEYSATLDVLGFDETRIRYRRERREILRHIIQEKRIGESLEAYAIQQIKKITLDKEISNEILEDIYEDLKYLDASRIIGLGVSMDDLNIWMSISK